MKKIIWRIIGIPLAICLCYLIGYIAKVAFFLVSIDNTDFGFPLWLDITIDIIAGVITYLFVLSLCGLSNQDRKIVEQVVSIIVGFVISFATHCLLRYWYIIIVVLAIFVIVAVVLFIKSKKDRRKI